MTLNYNKTSRLCNAAILLFLLIIFVTTESAALPIGYSVEHDPLNEITTITNFIDSVGSLRTFSTVIDPQAPGGVFNPIWIGPGGSIDYSTSGVESVSGEGYYTFIDNYNTQPEKEWTLIEYYKDKNTSPKEPWIKKWNGEWKQLEGNTISVCDWIWVRQNVKTVWKDGTELITIGSSDGPTKHHFGKPKPYPPPIDPPEDDPPPQIFNDIWYFNDRQAQSYVVYGGLQIPATDSLRFYSVATPVAGVGCVIPEPATMLLLGSGLIGLAGFRRRFKK